MTLDEWPDAPSLRLVIQGIFAAKAGRICSGGPTQCPNAIEGERCSGCKEQMLISVSGPGTEYGQLIQAATETMRALKLGIRLGLADISADVWAAMRAIEDLAGTASAVDPNEALFERLKSLPKT